MPYYLELPDFINSFITIPQGADSESIMFSGYPMIADAGHSPKSVDIKDFVSDEGLLWFANKGIILPQWRATLFKCIRNHTGTIHTDEHTREFAINFIIYGHGEMQWVDLDVPPDDFIEDQSSHFRWSNSRVGNINPLAKWSGTAGKAALVNINIPHRIVTTTADRICLSLQATKPTKFEQAAKLLNLL